METGGWAGASAVVFTRLVMKAGSIRVPNLVIDVTPLPLALRATMYRDGAEVMTTTIRRTAPNMLSPRAKMNKYLNMIVAGQPVKGGAPGCLVAAARREWQFSRGTRKANSRVLSRR